MKKLLLTFVLIAAGSTLWADPTVKLRMDVSPREITIGDPVRCNVTVIFSTSLQSLPLLAPATGEFELLAMVPPEIKTLPSGETQMTYPVIMTTFSTGTLSLPSFVLNFITPDGQRVEAKTQPLDIHVASLLEKHGDEGNLRPLKGTFNFRSYFWLWLTMGLLALATLLYFGLRHIKNKRRNTLETAGPPKPAEESAWEALQKLEDSDLRGSGQLKEFYVQLSDILRTYLERRFHISSMERTTSELLIEIRRLELPLDTTLILRVFIENSDLVKFAKFMPSDTAVEEDLNRVKQFITVTTPQKTQEPEKIPV